MRLAGTTDIHYYFPKPLSDVITKRASILFYLSIILSGDYQENEYFILSIYRVATKKTSILFYLSIGWLPRKRVFYSIYLQGGYQESEYLILSIYRVVRADPGNGPCQQKVLTEYINNNNNIGWLPRKRVFHFIYLSGDYQERVFYFIYLLGVYQESEYFILSIYRVITKKASLYFIYLFI